MGLLSAFMPLEAAQSSTELKAQLQSAVFDFQERGDHDKDLCLNRDDLDIENNSFT